MPVSRDRLSRPVDISTLLETAQRRVNLMVDEPGLRTRGLSVSNVSPGQGSSSSCRIGRRRVRGQRSRPRNRYFSSRVPIMIDQENRTPVGLRSGSGQGRRSFLPSWYPRTPLRDVTAIARAIERRRAEINRDRRTEASQQETNVSESNVQPEHDANISTPAPTFDMKGKSHVPPQLCNILDSVVKEESNESQFVTPQKKLLNSIENVRELWLEEQRKMEKTPAAKRAERERKVRTLMSMR